MWVTEFLRSQRSPVDRITVTSHSHFLVENWQLIIDYCLYMMELWEICKLVYSCDFLAVTVILKEMKLNTVVRPIWCISDYHLYSTRHILQHPNYVCNLLLVKVLLLMRYERINMHFGWIRCIHFRITQWEKTNCMWDDVWCWGIVNRHCDSLCVIKLNEQKCKFEKFNSNVSFYHKPQTSLWAFSWRNYFLFYQTAPYC